MTSKTPRILIIDDAAEIRTVLAALFHSEGFQVVSAADGQEAIGKFIEDATIGTSFDLISLDIRMPDMDGNTLALKLRELGYTGPMVAFTANASMAGKRTSTDAGISAYFSKSVLNRKLVQALKDQYCS